MKDWILMFTVVVVVLVSSLAMIRWLAPSLLGLPADLQLVSVDDKVPPFYENIFRVDDYLGDELLLHDPLTRVRARPLLPRNALIGPHDILGFRNLAVPNVADVVTIGDSMTYGNDAYMENNWPSVMADAIGAGTVSVYNMSTGGWGAVQYLEMFSNASLLRPRVIVVAFYTGNDPLESFMLTYADSRWDWLVPDSALDRSDAPHVEFPAPESEWWPVTFSDTLKTVFTPNLRLASNRSHPAVAAGYEIMARVMERIVQMSRDLDISLVATIIPTKELVYARRVEREGIEAPASYRQLVRQEAENIRKLRGRFAALPGLVYVDVLGPLQAAAQGPHQLYPEDINGHPLATGYAVIGKAIAGKVVELLPGRLQGRFAHKDGEIYHALLVTGDGYRLFSSPEVMKANGWPAEDVRVLTDRDLADIPFRGVIDTVDKAQFGPGRFHR